MIDIIIPAYNAFETIGKTLGSIAKQYNRENVKVYIINDGSDKSYDYIIENYKNLFSIEEITIENSGPGKARQVGIEASQNEYIVFIDADDTFYDSNSLLNLINIIPEADLAQGYFYEVKENETKTLEPQYCYLHGKMYRRSIIEKYNIKFDETRRYNGDIYEDSTFNQLYTLCCERINTTNEIVYVYDYNPNSITKSTHNVAQNLENFIDALLWLIKEIEQRKITNYHGIAWDLCISCFHIYYNYLISEEQEKFDFKKPYKIKKAYDKYIEYLPYEEQLTIYKFFDFPTIPIISFYDFMNKIKRS